MKAKKDVISMRNAISTPTILIFVFLLSLSFFIAVWLAQSVLYTTIDIGKYLVFHNITEFFSIMVSLSIFGIGWYAYDQSKNRHALFLSCAFLAIGLIDFMHTLSYSGMPDFITPNTPNKSSQLWIAGRLFSAIAFLISAFIYSDATYRWITKRILLTAALSISGLVFIGFIYYPSYLPATFIERAGLTPFKMYSEYVINAILAVALIAYWKRFSRSSEQVYIYFMAALIISIFSELAFTLYKSAFDTYNILGHVYKIFAFMLIYYGLFKSSVKYPYIELTNTMGKLSEKTEELDSFFTNALDLFCIADTDGNFHRLNKKWETTLGYRLEDMEDKRFLDLVHPDDIEETLEAISTLEAQKEVLNFINRYRCKDGSYRWIEWSSAISGKLIYAAARDITQHKQAEEEKVKVLHILEESLNEIYLFDTKTLKFSYVNKATLHNIGYTFKEIKELTPLDLKPEFTENTFREMVAPLLCGEKEILIFQTVHRRKDGSLYPVEVHLQVVQTGFEKVFLAVIYDITERKQAEDKILKLNRVYAVISQINQTIVRVRQKDKILSEACRIAIEYGKLKMAWVGMIDEQTNLVNPVAFSGFEDEYFSRIIKISVEDVPEGRGPTGTALRENRHYVCNDIEKDPKMALWREEALKRGFRSSVSFPIKQLGKVIGAFDLFASVPQFFDQEEINLLDEVTNDISFALDSIEIAKMKQEAEEALQKEKQFLAAVFDSIEEGIVSCDANGVLARFNRATREFHGLPEESIPADQWAKHYDLFLPDGKTPMKKEDVPLFHALQGKYVHNEEMMIIPKHGHARTFVASGKKLEDTEGKIIGAVVAMHDITERRKAEEELEKHRFHLEEMVNERTAELERMNRLFIGRESKMKELKKRIAELETEIPERRNHETF